MDEFDEYMVCDEEVEVEGEDELKLAEVYKLAEKLIKALEEIKSFELREAAALMLIKELVSEDKVLLGLATKMLQDICYGFEDKYVS